MTAELTAEEIVTNLLSSHEILKSNKNLNISSPLDLGTYLSNLPEEEDIKNHCASPIEKEVLESKYTFIKEGGWKF